MACEILDTRCSQLHGPPIRKVIIIIIRLTIQINYFLITQLIDIITEYSFLSKI